MPQPVQLDDILTRDVARRRFPKALDRRLQHLLDKNNEGQLTTAERQEAEALANMAEFLSLLHLRYEAAKRQA